MSEMEADMEDLMEYVPSGEFEFEKSELLEDIEKTLAEAEDLLSELGLEST